MKVSRKSFFTGVLLIITGLLVALHAVLQNWVKIALLQNMVFILAISAAVMTIVSFLIQIIPDSAAE